MNEITLKNYRCFRERQSAKLAPLTLLVGENSTGKTSFLALIRALTDLAFGFRMPDFKEEPYDLGSFDEIAHVRSGRGDRAKSFEAGLGSLPDLYTNPRMKSLGQHHQICTISSVQMGLLLLLLVVDCRVDPFGLMNPLQ